MAWCPKCKEEYREGITVCAECGTELVDSLPEEGQEQEKTMDSEEEKQEETDVSREDTDVSQEETEDSQESDSVETDSDEEYDWDAEDEVQEEDVSEQEEDTESESSEEESQTGFVSNTMYAKKSDEYKDLKFSGFTFIFFGVLGIVYLVLCKLEIIGLTYTLPIFIVLVLMFVVFIGVGVHSLIRSGRVKALIGDEDELTKKVEEAMASIMTQELIDSLYVEDATEEENFLALSEEVKGRIAEQFGTKDLTEAYIDQLIDEYYSEHYEK